MNRRPSTASASPVGRVTLTPAAVQILVVLVPSCPEVTYEALQVEVQPTSASA